MTEAATLCNQVALALRRGEALGAAAAAAVAGWHAKALRRQVQQTVWNHAPWPHLTMTIPYYGYTLLWLYLTMAGAADGVGLLGQPEPQADRHRALHAVQAAGAPPYSTWLQVVLRMVAWSIAYGCRPY